MKTSKVIIGIAAAAAAGVAIGMLIAPEKGSDIQKKILSGSKYWLDEISRLIQADKKLFKQGGQDLPKAFHEGENNSETIANG